ncbi:MAG: family 78 glycoside hydrolase catalytic domain [Lachnospiraceae bacterium]|nr:family 78 glycoside hydrolase catalytic domain [Lachnospiraceae bacterium]
MKKFKQLLAGLLILCMVVTVLPANYATAKKETTTLITDLRVDDLVSPIGIDAKNPVFSWKMESDVMGQKQNAYQIIVAKDESLDTVVWDSGKVDRNTSVGIPYEGEALESAGIYYYQIKVWDMSNEVITSKIAQFEMGLLEDNAFADAKWIGYQDNFCEETKYTIDFDFIIDKNNQGFCFGMKNTSTFVLWQVNAHDDANKVLLRPHFKKDGNWTAYPGGPGNVSAVDVSGAIGETPASIVGKKIHERIEVDGATVKTYFGKDTEHLTLADTYTHSEAIPFGNMGFRHDNGTANEISRYDNIVVKGSSGNTIYQNNFDEGKLDFAGASQITISDGMAKVGGNGEGGELVYMQSENGDCLPAFRKSITPKANLVSARLYSSGLGVYESYINGERVGNVQDDGSVRYDELKPGYLQPGVREYYNTYDVTSYLKKGEENVLSSVVTSGWWTGEAVNPSVYPPGTVRVGKENAYLAKLVLSYSDGTTEVVNTDESWKTKRASALKLGDIFNGETYDARIDQSWMLPGYDDASWGKVKINTEFKGKLSAWSGSRITVHEEKQRDVQTVTIYQGADNVTADQFGKINVLRTYEDENFTVKPGETALIDFGQNFAGWEKFIVEGEAGTTITVKHGEMLNDQNGKKNRGNDGPEGSIYNANYRAARATTTYTLKGNGRESYHPSFTYYGFRYIEIKTDREVTFHSLKGEVVSSVEKDTGNITTSNKDINQLISNIRWGMYSNYLSVPTDCPQRDERQGWTADTQVFAEAGSYFGFSKSFLMKFMEDMRDGQYPNGNYATTAPHTRFEEQGTLGWADAGVIVPYVVYMMYGDTAVIRENWESMSKFMDFLTTTDKLGGDTLHGDWLAYESNDEELKRMLGVSYYAWDAMLMARMAKAIGKEEDARKYEAVYEDEKQFYQECYVKKDGSLIRGEQSVCLYALYLDLLPDEASKKAVEEQLTSNITRNGNKLQTGFLGTAVLMPTLSKINNNDIAYKLLLQRDNPSWLYSVDQGATTIWERWDSYKKSTGFGDVSMNSFNHYAYGTVAGWMFHSMAGIGYDLEQPGFKHIILAPNPKQQISSVSADYDSSYGTIKSSWKYEGKGWTYDATIPANTTATIQIPVEEGKQLLVNEKEVSKLTEEDGLTYIGRENGKECFEAVAGSYHFAVALDKVYHFITIKNVNDEIENTVSVDGGAKQKLTTMVSVAEGESVTLKGEPLNSVDYHFKEWSGDVESKEATITVSPTKDMVLYLDNEKDDKENLALHCNVSSNCAWSVASWAPRNLVDGILRTTPESAGFTSQQAQSENVVNYWIQLDLGEEKEFDRISLYPRSDDTDSRKQVCNFPKDFTITATNEAGEVVELCKEKDYVARSKDIPECFTFEKTTARYIKLSVSKVSNPASSDSKMWYLQLAEMGVYAPKKVQEVPEETKPENNEPVVVHPTGVSLTMNGKSLNGTISVNVGKTYTVIAQVLPSNVTAANSKITWTSSNPKVLSVNNGVIKGVKAGSVSLTATTVNGIKKSITVKVIKPVIKVKKLTITGKKKMKVGTKQTLKCKVTPGTATNKKVTWSTSNKKRATVKNGKVKALKKGKVTITAKAVDGSKKKAKFVITIK